MSRMAAADGGPTECPSFLSFWFAISPCVSEGIGKDNFEYISDPNVLSRWFQPNPASKCRWSNDVAPGDAGQVSGGEREPPEPPLRRYAFG
jgi:hypothetical protein